MPPEKGLEVREVHGGLRKGLGRQQGYMADLDFPLREALKMRGGFADHLRLSSFCR